MLAGMGNLSRPPSIRIPPGGRDAWPVRQCRRSLPVRGMAGRPWRLRVGGLTGQRPGHRERGGTAMTSAMVGTIGPQDATVGAHPGYHERKADHLARLRKAEGQVRGIARMVEADR